MNDFAQWESELEHPAYAPPMVAALRLGEQWQALNPAPAAPRDPYRKTTDIWTVRYHAGRYWHLNLHRKSGAPIPTLNYAMRGAFVCAPLDTGYPRRAGAPLPLAWYGPRLGQIQTFTYDDETPRPS